MPSVEAALADFLLANEADNLKPKTLRWYKALLTSFCDRFASRPLEEITTAMIRQYIVSLRRADSRYNTGNGTRPKEQGGLSEESIAAHVRALHRFWHWNTTEYRLSVNPMENIRRPKRLQPDPKGVAFEDVRALLGATNATPFGSRDRAIILFLLDTGCRAQGVIQLTDAKLDLSDRRAIVSEKGAANRSLFLQELTCTFLKVWLAVRPAKATTVFCNKTGAPLTYHGLREVLRRLKARAGISGPVNPHSFRHGFAREYIKAGGDLATLSRLMGHSNTLVTAMYYAVFTGAELAEQHNKFSPVNRLTEV